MPAGNGEHCPEPPGDPDYTLTSLNLQQRGSLHVLSPFPSFCGDDHPPVLLLPITMPTF